MRSICRVRLNSPLCRVRSVAQGFHVLPAAQPISQVAAVTHIYIYMYIYIYISVYNVCSKRRYDRCRPRSQWLVAESGWSRCPPAACLAMWCWLPAKPSRISLGLLSRPLSPTVHYQIHATICGCSFVSSAIPQRSKQKTPGSSLRMRVRYPTK